MERSAGGFSCDGAPSFSAWRFSRRTGWTQNLQTPLRRFLRTETGGAVVLLTATLAALAWANVDPAGYAATWHTVLTIRSGRWELATNTRGRRRARRLPPGRLHRRTPEKLRHVFLPAHPS